MMNSKHEFAVHVPGLSSQLSSKSGSLSLSDTDVVHRIRSVLRLAQGDELMLFDSTQHAACSIIEITKKTISVRIISSDRTISLQPSITFLLPLLKREALERMIYACVELGATTIQLISTEKSQRSWRSEKELQRMHAIMIAAAEQSKQFSLPILQQPIYLQEAIQLHAKDTIKLVADPVGLPLYEVLTQIVQKKSARIVMTMGPEGDLSDGEKEILRTASYQAVRLTPTVLRSQQAGALLLGVVRSMVSTDHSR